MEGQRVVIPEGRFERSGPEFRVVDRSGGYWLVERCDWPPRAGVGWCRIEGIRSGFSYLSVTKVRRNSDGVVVHSGDPWWYSGETIFVGGVVIASFVIAVVDTLSRAVS